MHLQYMNLNMHSPDKAYTALDTVSEVDSLETYIEMKRENSSYKRTTDEHDITEEDGFHQKSKYARYGSPSPEPTNFSPVLERKTNDVIYNNCSSPAMNNCSTNISACSSNGPFSSTDTVINSVACNNDRIITDKDSISMRSNDSTVSSSVISNTTPDKANVACNSNPHQVSSDVIRLKKVSSTSEEESPPYNGTNRSECTKCQPEQVFARVLSKLRCSSDKHDTWIEKELSVKELRQIIPLLMIRVFDSKCIPSLKKVKGIWDSPPPGWPPDLPYCDPNNGNRALGKPRKNMLTKTLLFLLDKYKEKYGCWTDDRQTKCSACYSFEQSVTQSKLSPSYSSPTNIDTANNTVSPSPQSSPVSVTDQDQSSSNKIPSLIALTEIPIESKAKLYLKICDKLKNSPNSKDFNNVSSCNNVQPYLRQQSSPNDQRTSAIGQVQNGMFRPDKNSLDSDSILKTALRSVSWDSYEKSEKCNNSMDINVKAQQSFLKNHRIYSQTNTHHDINTAESRSVFQPALTNSVDYMGAKNPSMPNGHPSMDQISLNLYEKLDSGSARKNKIGSGFPRHPLLNVSSSLPSKCSSPGSSFESSSLASVEEFDDPPIGSDPTWSIYNRMAEKVHYLHWKGWLTSHDKKTLYIILDVFKKKWSKLIDGAEEVFLEQAHQFDLSLDVALINKGLPCHHVNRWTNFLSGLQD